MTTLTGNPIPVRINVKKNEISSLFEWIFFFHCRMSVIEISMNMIELGYRYDWDRDCIAHGDDKATLMTNLTALHLHILFSLVQYSLTPPFVLHATYQWQRTPRKLREVVVPTTLSGERIGIASNGVVIIAVAASSSLSLSYYSGLMFSMCMTLWIVCHSILVNIYGSQEIFVDEYRWSWGEGNEMVKMGSNLSLNCFGGC